jgi:hypothetical protein
MRKRLLLMLGCVAAVLLAGYMTLRLTGPRHRITEENIKLIKKGMTEEEVEAILGSKAGSIPDGTLHAPNSLTVDSIDTRSSKHWVGKDVDVSVGFDADGRVTSVTQLFILDRSDRPETILDKLRRWLGMQ